jgi:hypothetical protein
MFCCEVLYGGVLRLCLVLHDPTQDGFYAVKLFDEVAERNGNLLMDDMPGLILVDDIILNIPVDALRRQVLVLHEQVFIDAMLEYHTGLSGIYWIKHSSKGGVLQLFGAELCFTPHCFNKHSGMDLLSPTLHQAGAIRAYRFRLLIADSVRTALKSNTNLEERKITPIAVDPDLVREIFGVVQQGDTSTLQLSKSSTTRQEWIERAGFMTRVTLESRAIGIAFTQPRVLSSFLGASW